VASPGVAAVCAALVFGPLLAALFAWLVPQRRLHDGVAVGLATGLLAALGWLTDVLLVRGPARIALGGHAAPVGIELAVDGLTLVMLWLTGIVALAVNLHATAWARGSTGGHLGTTFRSLWLLLWSGLNALFLSADLFNLYVTLEIATLAAVPLVVLSRGAEAVAAAARYLYFALAGSILFLLGVALVYAETGLLGLAALREAQWSGPGALAALAAMTLGLAIKAALFPVHGWLPRAHASAPSEASAVLSALVAKAGVYLVLRLWLGPFEGHYGSALAQGLAAVGAAGILYGSLQALIQPRLKLVVAYSTIAQLGYLLLALPLASLLAWQGVLYHALAHGLAKAALFLAAGNLIRVVGNDHLELLAGGDRRLALNLAAIGLAGVSLAGLPPSGGFIAKWWLLSAALDGGQWWWALVIALGGLLSAAYVFRVLRYGLLSPDPRSGGALHHSEGRLPGIMLWSPLALAIGAIALGFAGAALAPMLAIGVPEGIAR
jgi:multicomponent Na+:H+ antiporter subunit D